MQNLQSLFYSLKVGKGKGFHGHAGRPGKIGGSKPKWTGSFVNNLKIEGHKEIADGIYKSVHFTKTNVDTAKKKASNLGPDYKVIRYKDFYHIIDTASKQTTISSKPKTEVESLYNQQSVERQEFAKKYGLLATDDDSEKYLKEIEHKIPVVNIGSKSKTDLDTAIYQDIDKNSLQHSEKRENLEAAFKFGRIFNKDTGEYTEIKTTTHKIIKQKDAVSSTGERFFVVPLDYKKPTKGSIPVTPFFEPDFDKMSGLKTVSSSKLNEINDSIQKTWNHNDHTGFKAKALNAFQIVHPKVLVDEYNTVKASIGNEKFSMYHGTDHQGASYITRTGYRVNPTPKIGRLFGNGLYLADEHSKSIQYAHDGAGSSWTYARGVIFYNRAALGTVVTATDSSGHVDYSNNLNPGIDTLRIKPNATSWKTSREYVVKQERGVLPTIWVDIEREPA